MGPEGILNLLVFISYILCLPFFPKGPMVHIGAMVGAAVGQMKSKTLRFYPRVSINIFQENINFIFIIVIFL